MNTTVVLVVLLVAVISAALYFLARPKPLPKAPSSRRELDKTVDSPRKKPEATTKAADKTKEAKTSQPQTPAAPKVKADAPSKAEALSKSPAPPESRPAPSKPRPSEKEVAELRKGLTQTRKGFIGKIADLLSGKKEIDASILEELEEVLLTSDVGPETTAVLVERMKGRLEKKELADSEAVWRALRAEAIALLSLPGGAISLAKKPTVVMMVGVNGAGKTTTIGKLATHFAGENKKVLLGAGDTFRAAAVAQLEVWGKRVGADVVRGKDGADPGAVAFQATEKACQEGVDLLLFDTAGRLQNKQPLMDEIRKVRRTIAKAEGSAPHEILLVVDATTGQNGLSQAKLFQEALDLTGIVLTKLDGTAKGGIVLGIAEQLKVPVRYIGLGERAEDLREFHPEAFVEALFASPEAAKAS